LFSSASNPLESALDGEFIVQRVVLANATIRIAFNASAFAFAPKLTDACAAITAELLSVDVVLNLLRGRHDASHMPRIAPLNITAANIKRVIVNSRAHFIVSSRLMVVIIG
jgi:hypothetical protein